MNKKNFEKDDEQHKNEEHKIRTRRRSKTSGGKGTLLKPRRKQA